MIAHPRLCLVMGSGGGAVCSLISLFQMHGWGWQLFQRLSWLILPLGFPYCSRQDPSSDSKSRCDQLQGPVLCRVWPTGCCLTVDFRRPRRGEAEPAVPSHDGDVGEWLQLSAPVLLERAGEYHGPLVQQREEAHVSQTRAIDPLA